MLLLYVLDQKNVLALVFLGPDRELCLQTGHDTLFEATTQEEKGVHTITS